jgi:chemotaxis response regulator CheB
VIVVDLNLPDFPGLDVCRQITRDNPRVKVIVISAMADDDIRDEALAVGASGFFPSLPRTSCSLPSQGYGRSEGQQPHRSQIEGLRRPGPRGIPGCIISSLLKALSTGPPQKHRHSP